MGKKSSSSWLTAVKRAFRSPTKKDHHDPEEDELKKREKRRWIFRKPANQDSPSKISGGSQLRTDNPNAATSDGAVEVASAAAAETTVAMAPAVVEAARVTTVTADHDRDQYAAVVIQTAFRGYLARRALRALKGIVQLQALVRGHNVRKQAKTTLRCMQSLLRLQSRVLDQRKRLSHDGSSRKSAFSDTHSVFESRYLQDISDRRSMSREGSSVANDRDDRPRTIEEVKAMLQQRRDTALRRENTLSQAFSQQMWRTGGSHSMGDEEELEERPKWLDRWMASKPWDIRSRASTDHQIPVKTVEMDTNQPYSYLPPNYSRSRNQNHNQRSGSPMHRDGNNRPGSPMHRDGNQRPGSPSHRSHHYSLTTPSPAKSRPIQIRSASPRYQRDDRTSTYHYTSNTPSLRSNYSYAPRSSTTADANPLPSYMAATESAKARIRSQSAPRHRPSTPERERLSSAVARKRLSYPDAPPNAAGGYGGQYGNNNSLRSPSFKSVVSGSHIGGGLEHQSNYSSCCTESIGGEISPSSTSDLRRWLR